MKSVFRNLFSPILNVFESGQETYLYQKSHRVILIVMGVLFSGLGGLVFVLSRGEDIGYFIPVLVFGGAGLLSLLIGVIGNDRAVAKIWGSSSK